MPYNCYKTYVVKYKGKTIYPTGKWNGTYFSEEIKAVLALNLGYKFKIIKGHRFLLRVQVPPGPLSFRGVEGREIIYLLNTLKIYMK